MNYIEKIEKEEGISNLKIGFINPPSPFLINQRVFVTLGILRVATSVKNSHNHNNVFFLDLSDQSGEKELIKNFIEKNQIDVIGITSTTPQISVVLELCKFIKSNYNIRIILGGPHITMIYSSLINSTNDVQEICTHNVDEILKYVDTIVIGDGEISIFEAISKGGKIINSEIDDRLFLTDEQYDSISTDRSLLDIDSYKYDIDGKKSTNIISQIGCPFKCEFCSGRSSRTFSRIRKRSVDSVIKEIDFLYKTYGYEGFMFYDDELNLNKRRFHDLLRGLIEYQKKEKVEFNFRGFTRSDILNDEQSKLMMDAGFKWLLVGFESGSNRILKNMNKGCSVEDNNKCFEIAKNNGLKVKALMSIGHPGESEETIDETIKWLEKVKPDETDVSIISVYPGSNYFNKSVKVSDDVLKYNVNDQSLYIKNIDFLKDSNFYKSKSDEYKSYVYTDYLTEDQIVYFRNKIDKITKEF